MFVIRLHWNGNCDQNRLNWCVSIVNCAPFSIQVSIALLGQSSLNILIHIMDVQTTGHQLLQAADGQRYSLQQLLEKLLSRNKFAPAEVEHFQTLVKNVRDAKNFQKIMDKFKIGQHMLDGDEEAGGGGGGGGDTFKEGEFREYGLNDVCFTKKKKKRS